MGTALAIAQRMREVIEAGRVKNASAWSSDAGLTRQHVSTFMARAEAGEEPDIGTKTLIELARVARVRYPWLATGEPPRDVDAIPEDLPHVLAEIMASDDVDEGRRGVWTAPVLRALLAAVGGGLQGLGEITRRQWLENGDAIHRALQRAEKGLAPKDVRASAVTDAITDEIEAARKPPTKRRK